MVSAAMAAVVSVLGMLLAHFMHCPLLVLLLSVSLAVSYAAALFRCQKRGREQGKGLAGRGKLRLERRIIPGMSFFVDTQETTERFGKYIGEYQELFRKYGVSFGAPEDFFRLTPKLAYDDGFRVDFSALTKDIGHREQGTLTLTRVLTIVALALGGDGVKELGSGSAVSVSLVVVFLAGVGGWSEKEMDAARAPDLSSRAMEEKRVVRAREDVVLPVRGGERSEEKEAQ